MSNKIFTEDDLSKIENILKNLPFIIFFKDTEGKYVFSTKYWDQLNTDNNDPNWTIRGKTDLEVRKDIENAKLAHEMDLKIMETKESVNYVIHFTENDFDQYLELHKNPVFDDNGKVIGIVGLVSDVTVREKQRLLLEEMAIYDKLTGMFNRSYYETIIEEKIEDKMFPLTILVVDCNSLKRINDTFGHRAGDTYIKKTANLLNICLPDESFRCRIGGDEFVCLIPELSKKEAIKYYKRLGKMSKASKFKDTNISISYGMITINKGDSIRKAIKEADERMYEMKRKYHKENDNK